MKSTRKLFEQKESDYDKFFNEKLKEYGIDSPEDLSDEDKKKFFDDVDEGWKSEKEKS